MIADSSVSYTIDVDALNSGGTLSTSSSYKENATIVGFVDGNFGNSNNYIIGSGLVYLELLCGNGILELGETCDDGNTTNGDGCNSICQNEVCGNGIIDWGEACDDGNTTNGDGCNSLCQNEVIVIPPTPGGGGGGGGRILSICGNGIKEGIEQCDDGNRLNNDGCDSSCKLEDGLKPAAEKVKRTFKIKAWPEKRVNTPGNWGTEAKVVFYNRDFRSIVYQAIIPINDQGWGILETDEISEGMYHISVKGLSHLTKVMRNKEIKSKLYTLDFTFGETFYLLAGDSHSDKDDFVNGLDIATEVEKLYNDNVHADLNKDGMVNGLDISITVGNLYKYGQTF